MGEKLMESKARLSLHLEGESEIDASLLAKTINDMAGLTKFAAKENNPEAYLKMNVTAFQNGSFQIDFSAICEVAEDIINAAPQIATFASGVVATVVGFIEIKKHLKGKKPKNVSDISENIIEVENDFGSKIQVSKCSKSVITNMQIDQLTINIANYAQQHNPNGGFSLNTQYGEVNYTSDDIKEISKSIPIEEEIVCKRTKIEIDLPIKKADLLGRSKWTFSFRDKYIEATISDEDFIEIVHDGASVRAKDWIKATLEIYVDLDSTGKPIDGSERYTVIEVHGDIHHNYEYQQMTL